MKREFQSNEQGLSPRDLAVLMHVDRFRLMTVSLIRRGPLAGLSRSGASKVLNRLIRSGYLSSFILKYPERYFVIGEEGIRLLGRGKHRVLPLGPQSLPIEYATAMHCLLSKIPKKRLQRREVDQQFPCFSDCPTETPICVEEISGRVELLRIDLGGLANHIARKCREDIESRLKVVEFQSMVTSGRFRLVVITGMKEKADAIREALDRQKWPTGFQLHCSIVTDLLFLTARKSDA